MSVNERKYSNALVDVCKQYFLNFFFWRPLYKKKNIKHNIFFEPLMFNWTKVLNEINQMSKS